MNILREAVTPWDLSDRLYSSLIDNSCGPKEDYPEFEQFHRWIHARNVVALHTVWARSEFDPRLEPVVVSHAKTKEVIKFHHLELITRETTKDTILQYDLDDRSGYPVGFFKDVRSALKYSTTNSKLKTILMCLGGRFDNDGTDAWHTRSEGHRGGDGTKYKVTNVTNSTAVRLISPSEVSDYTGERLSTIQSLLAAARVTTKESVMIDDIRLTILPKLIKE